MTIVSSSEFENNVSKYFDMAENEEVVIKQAQGATFTLQKREYLTPDEDLARAISADELLDRVIPEIEKMFDE